MSYHIISCFIVPYYNPLKTCEGTRSSIQGARQRLPAKGVRQPMGTRSPSRELSSYVTVLIQVDINQLMDLYDDIFGICV